MGTRRGGVCIAVVDPGIGPVPEKVPSCPFLIVKSSGVSNWAASKEVSNRGYKCVFASPKASRCFPTSNPYYLRSRLLERASRSAWSSVSTAPLLVCAFAQGNRQSAAANTQNSDTTCLIVVVPWCISLLSLIRQSIRVVTGRSHCPRGPTSHRYVR